MAGIWNNSVDSLQTLVLDSGESKCVSSASGVQGKKADVLGNRQKPKRISIDPVLIPDELKAKDRWLSWIWKWDAEKNKWQKPPINSRTGGYGNSTNPDTWCSFETAIATVEAGVCDGIGFALGDADGVYFAGVDLDDCRDPNTGALTEFAREVIATLDTYCEVSPSGTGVKLICMVSTPPDKPTANKALHIEVYGDKRYFTVTSCHLEGTPASIERRQAELAQLWNRYIGCAKSKDTSKSTSPSKIVYFGDNSDADAALQAMLCISLPEEEGDGSKRLFKVACRAVEHDLNDDQAIAAIRKYSETHPFPTNWSDDAILTRVRDAEEYPTVVRGGVWRIIDVTEIDLAVATPRAWKALQIANDPPELFRSAGSPSRIELTHNEEPKIVRLEEDQMRHHLARAAKWRRFTRFGEKLVEPPMSIVKDVLATPSQPLPFLHRIVEAPVFASDGTLQTTAGYHAASQTIYAPKKGFLIADVPEYPTPTDIHEARTLLSDELMGDFPFVSESEKAHAMALLLLPFARDLISGPTPLHLIEKPSPGTGASLLIDLIAYPALGRSISAMTEAGEEEEWRKRITAKLRNGPSFVLIDNLGRRLDSAALSSAITATNWEDRLLSLTQIICVPVRCAWVATGNNPAVSTEISRRIVRIRLDAKVDRPWQRDGFRIPDIRSWVQINRAALVRAALVLIQAWISAGKPTSSEKRLGMFEKWSEVMGGILKIANVPGFLENLDEFYDGSDEEGSAWREFLGKWWDKFQSTPTSVKDLWQLVEDSTHLQLGGGGVQSQKATFGKMLKARKDSAFNMDGTPSMLVIKSGGKRQHACLWQLATSA